MYAYACHGAMIIVMHGRASWLVIRIVSQCIRVHACDVNVGAIHIDLLHADGVKCVLNTL